jgi:hypothetical protein
MAFFERYFLEDKALHKENYNAYYKFSEREDVCGRILSMFGLDPKTGHIINGHVPVKIKNGESPVKANGRLFVIDGGISKAYQKATGIAGYTLIYDSHSLNLAEHKPFVSGGSGLTPEIHLVEKLPRRANISDTDKGHEILEQINEKYKGQFTDADKVIIDALHQKLKKNAKLLSSAKTTDPVIFTESIFPQIFSATAMENYTESQESYESLFKDKNKYNAIMSALAGVIYREMRTQNTDNHNQ